MAEELSQHITVLKLAIHKANEALSRISSLKPEELLTLFEDSQDPTNNRDRFIFISNSLLSLGTNLSEARLVLLNLGQYTTIENWISSEKKKNIKAFLTPETGEDSTGKEEV